VTFTQFHAPYNAGDKAGFVKEQADDLIRRKLAVLTQPVLERIGVVKAEPVEESKPEPKVEEAPKSPPSKPSPSADHGRHGRHR
jgi:hypothetical protein